jgi:class 3 adenylate cyclase
VELDTAGDGFFARFDGPARAIRCALAIHDAMRDLGLEVRLGLHTGECEVLDGKVAGIAVAIGARVAARAAAGEVLVSQTVKDLVAGSGIGFDDRGLAELKGVPGEWRLYAVTSPSPTASNLLQREGRAGRPTRLLPHREPFWEPSTRTTSRVRRTGPDGHAPITPAHGPIRTTPNA